ncbi:MAG: ABC transporter ATP-binding protein [Paracoccaceae bacterium]
MPRPDPAYSSRRLLARLWQGYLRPHAAMMAAAFALMVVEGSTLGNRSAMLEPLFDRVFTDGRADEIPVGRAGDTGAVRDPRNHIGRHQDDDDRNRPEKLDRDAGRDLLVHILTLDGRFFQSNPPGALMERVQGDTLAVQGVWTALITGIGRDIVALVALFGVAFSIDWRWTFAALIGAPLLILPTLVVQRYIRRKTEQMRAQAGQRATRLDEIFHGIVPIKLNRMETYQLGRFRRIVGAIVRAEVRTMLGRSAMPALIDIVTGIGFFAVLMLGGREIINGTRTVGEFMAFFTAMALTFQPLRRLGDLSGIWQIAAASLERIYRLFDTAPQTTHPANSQAAIPAGPPDIVLRDVAFAYEDMPVLTGASFTAEAGKTTALVGRSGAGKSTVFNLLTGLVEPEAGQILLGGVDIAALGLADLRAQFAVVTQDPALFDETLHENLILGREDIAPAALQAAMRAAQVDDIVENQPLGLETPVGPRGSALSGGQKQRVAIARALLRDAPVLLLDEPTSALDARSEAQVQAALGALAQGRTTLVIAHRLSTIRSADKIVVMDHGRVVEEGRHDALLARGGLYAELCALQFGADD